jgi:16S rRNA (guanine527-N7)-methyltransferase
VDPWDELDQAVYRLGLRLDAAFKSRARVYCEELSRWTQVARLTGYRSKGEQVQHLVVESLLLLSALPDDAGPLLDIGSGAGAPGLVLKLARPEWVVGLVEANRRRANFLRHVIRTLRLDGIEVHAERAEILAREPSLSGAFRTVTLRAVAAPEDAASLARPFLGPEGVVVIPVGPAGIIPPIGRVRQVELRGIPGLPAMRRFLIIGAADIDPGVSRGTRRKCGARPGGRQPKRGRREDDYGR